MPTIQFAGSQQRLEALLADIPAMLAGTVPDTFGVVDGIKMRVANSLLSKVQQAFIVKSRGGVGEDGIQWPPLKRETIAQRRTTAGERKALGITGRRERGLLTPAENKKWKGIFASQKSRLMVKFGMGDAAAGARAAQIAWSILKQEGAKTKLQVLGSRVVDILRDTGELFRSLTPGIAQTPSNADGQLLTMGKGTVTVGTNKKTWHHLGVPGKLPARNLWPPDGNLPSEWWDDMTEQAAEGISDAIVMILPRLT